MNRIQFVLDGNIHTIDFDIQANLKPSTSVLNYLRSLPGHRGVKEGCGEGDCGACTVVIAEPDKSGKKLIYKAIDSCLVFLPYLHGKQLITVENLAVRDGNEVTLHPAQQTIVDTHGTQCGYCTPGFVMSLFAIYKKDKEYDKTELGNALAGNLCRCTGYRPLVDAAVMIGNSENNDLFCKSEKEVLKMLRTIQKENETISLSGGGQKYAKPVDIGEAVFLRHINPEALVVAGATDIALRQTKKHEFFPAIHDVSDVSELRGLRVTKKEIIAGACVTMEELRMAAKDVFPTLFDLLSVFASRQIRNIATIGGNVGSASPIGDTLPFLMATGAEISLTGPKGLRDIPMNEFITGYRQTVLEPNELIACVTIPIPPKDVIVKTYKSSKRKDLDISMVSGGFRLKLLAGNKVGEIILAFGGMAATTKRAVKTEKFLSGKTWTQENIDKAIVILETEFKPLSDARTDAETRLIIAGNLLKQFYFDSVG
ncbi:MAG: xanthine dehydrogenase small subunit [Bacteroidetes bacterium]|nr:xanthine dehydrogenase small subunit [Bacteroidota bacterium]MBU1720367.1 xanthine dehydrogenase small subunit [Bacteroidota bacterium]